MPADSDVCRARCCSCVMLPASARAGVEVRVKDRVIWNVAITWEGALVGASVGSAVGDISTALMLATVTVSPCAAKDVVRATDVRLSEAAITEPSDVTVKETVV